MSISWSFFKKTADNACPALTTEYMDTTAQQIYISENGRIVSTYGQIDAGNWEGAVFGENTDIGGADSAMFRATHEYNGEIWASCGNQILRYKYIQDISDLIISADTADTSDSPIRDISVSLRRPDEGMIDDYTTLFCVGGKITVDLMMGDSAKERIITAYCDEHDWSQTDNAMTVRARNAIGYFLSDATFDERTKYTGTRKGILYQMLEYSGIPLYTLIIENDTTEVEYEFKYNDRKFDKIKSLLTEWGWKIAELPDGKVLIGSQTLFNTYAPKGTHTYDKNTQGFEYHIVQRVDSSYSRIAVVSASEETNSEPIIEYRDLSTFRGWGLPKKTKYIDTLAGTPREIVAALADEYKKAYDNIGVTAEIRCPIRPSAAPGDLAVFANADVYSYIPQGIITSVRHTYGISGIMTHLTIDSGGTVIVGADGRVSTYTAADVDGDTRRREMLDEINRSANSTVIAYSNLSESGGGKETDPTVPSWAKQPEKPTYTAAEVGALPYDTEIPSYSVATQGANGLMSASDKKKLDGIPEGGGGGITEETDPTVPSWAKQPEKPTYTASEVGADSDGSAASALSDAKTYIDEKVKTNVPENALFTDTVYDDTEIKTALNNEATARANGDGALQDSLYDHINDTSNPHSITKSQVGLGNVDNTSDADKPISTAMQTALDKKLDKSGGTISGDSFGFLELKRNTEWQTCIKFSNTKGDLGYIGIQDINGDIIHTFGADTSKQYSVLDSNNYKSIISTSDSSSASALSSSDTNYPTVRDIYYGLPNINGSHAYTSGTSIYAPTSTGTSGYELISNGSGAPIWKAPSYAVCGTSASTAAKTASIANFKLVTGATVKIKFSYAHTSTTAATLNVNSTGAKTIYTHSGTSNVSVTSSHSWRAGEIVEFVYDGSYWVAVSSDQGFVEASSVGMQNALNGKLDGSWSDANGFANISELSLAAGDAYNTVFGSLGSDNEFAGIYELGVQVSDNRDAIETKQATITGGASTITSSNLTASRALVSDSNGKVAVSAVTSTELGYIDGVTSNVQTQLNEKAQKSHASTTTTYGIGTSSNFGHVKLSDSTSTTSGTRAGVAATPTAVKAAYDKANIMKDPSSTTGDIIKTHLTVGNRASNTYGTSSFACGENLEASGKCSFATGWNSKSQAVGSFAMGYNSVASGNYSVAMGFFSNALAYQTKLGRYATDGTAGSASGTTGDALTVGIGISSADKNGFRVDYSGNGYFYKAVSGTGADYAEMWEWQDGNPNSEDRVGYFVAFDGDKIRFANENDDLRKVGIISGNPAVIGDNFADDWQGMYLQDIYGRNITEHKSYEAEYDEDGNLIHEAYEADEYVLNPDYDATQPYIPRQQRKEWDAVGTHGKLVVKDDGTCQVDGFCRPTDGGIATASDNGFYVMERINDTHIRVYLR